MEKITAHIESPSRREYFLAYLRAALADFAAGIMGGRIDFWFSLLQYGAGEHVQLSENRLLSGGLLYHSGETFFTLGYGDIVPISAVARPWR